MRKLFLMVLAGLVVASAVPGTATAQEAEPIRWKGLIAGQLEFFVTFTAAEGGGYTATIDIPAQGLSGGELTEVVYTDTEMAFTLPIAPPSGAAFKVAREDGGSTASGNLEQGGQQVPITMELLEEGEAGGPPPRPQTPEPPFPYREREASYANPDDGTELAGTLTIPEGDGPFAAVVMITGSGAQNRDEELLGHKPFLVIADHLTRNGIAVLRVDDRGVGGSTGNIATSTSRDFAGDALAGVAYLTRQPEIDAGKIGLIGHSEGGIVAPIAAARSGDIAFIVLLAGTGMSGAELLPLQVAAIARAMGQAEEDIATQVAAQRRINEVVVAGGSRDDIRAAVAEVAAAQRAALPEDQRPSDEEQQAAIDAGADQLASTWMRFFLAYDPRDALRDVRVPVLALNGALDLQVPAEPNLGGIRVALAEAGNADVTTQELEGLNHLFQTATTGSPTEYMSIEETFSPRALDIITEWIIARTAR